MHLVALLWVLYSVAAFTLPYTFPVTSQNFNWAPVALAICLLLLLFWWILDARHWFTGPRLRPSVDRLGPTSAKGAAHADPRTRDH